MIGDGEGLSSSSEMDRFVDALDAAVDRFLSDSARRRVDVARQLGVDPDPEDVEDAHALDDEERP